MAATSPDQATLKAESTRIFNRTFAVTAALNVFTLGVAGVALLTSLLTLSNSRLPQLAPLWAIGITRRRLAGIELLKTMSVALITALLALPLGLAGGVVPDRGGQREGLRLAAAVSCLPAATAASCSAWRCWPRCWRRCFRFSNWCGCSRRALIKIFADER